MKILLITLMFGLAAAAQETHESDLKDVIQEKQNIYLAPLMDGHPECTPETKSLMRCPINELAQAPEEPVSEFLDRELAWGVRFEEDYPGCAKRTDHLLVCK